MFFFPQQFVFDLLDRRFGASAPMSESLPRSFQPIWLGNLPHDPQKLREVEHHLAIAIAKICEEMGEKVDAEDLCFRFHTKGASFNGKGLGLVLYGFHPPQQKNWYDVAKSHAQHVWLL